MGAGTTYQLRILVTGQDQGGKDLLSDIGDGLAKIGLQKLGLDAIMGTLKGVFDTTRGFIEGNVELEKYNNSLAIMVGSRQGAEQLLATLKDIADNSPLETDEIVAGTQNLLSYGIASRDIRKDVLLLGDATSTLGVDFKEATFWYGRFDSMVKAGRPAGEALERLQELKLLTAEQRNQVEQAIAAGKSYSEIMAIVDTGLEKFAGGMKLQSLSIAGMESTFDDSMARIRNTLAQPLSDAYAVSLQGILDLLDPQKHPEVQAGIELLRDGIQGVLEGIAAVFGVNLQAIEAARKKQIDDLTAQINAQRQQTEINKQHEQSAQDLLKIDERRRDALQEQLDRIKDANQQVRDQLNLQKQNLQNQIDDAQKATKAQLLPIEQQLYDLGVKRKDVEGQLKDLQQQQKEINDFIKEQEQARVEALQGQLATLKEQDQARRDQLAADKQALQDQISALQDSIKNQLLPIEQQLYDVSTRRKDVEDQLHDVIERQKEQAAAVAREQQAQLTVLQAQYEATVKQDNAERDRLATAKQALQDQMDALRSSLQDQLAPVEQALTDLAKQRADVEGQLRDLIAQQKDDIDQLKAAEQARIQALEDQYDTLEQQNNARREQNNLIIQGIKAQLGELDDQVNQKTKPMEDELTRLTIRRHELELEALGNVTAERQAEIKDELDGIAQRTKYLQAEKQVIEDSFLLQKQSLEEQQKAAEEKAKAEEAEMKAKEDALKQQLELQKQANEEELKAREDADKQEQAVLQAKLDSYKQQEASLEEQKQQIEDANKLQQEAIQDQIKLLDQKGKEEERQMKAQEQALKDQIDAQKQAYQEQKQRQDDLDKQEQKSYQSKIDALKQQEESLNTQKHNIEENGKRQEEALQSQLKLLERRAQEEERQMKASEDGLQKQIELQRQANEENDKAREAEQKAEQAALQAKLDGFDKQKDQLDAQKHQIEENSQKQIDALQSQLDGLNRYGQEVERQQKIQEDAREREIKDLDLKIKHQKQFIDDMKDQNKQMQDANQQNNTDIGQTNGLLDETRIKIEGIKKQLQDTLAPLKPIADFVKDNLHPILVTLATVAIAGVAIGLGALIAAAGPVLLALGAIAIAAAALTKAWDTNFLNIRDIVKGTIPWIGDRLGELKTWFTQTLPEAVGNAIPALQQNLGHIKDELTGWAGDRLNDIKLKASEWGEAISSWPGRSIGYLQKELENTWFHIRDWIGGKVHDISEAAKGFGTGLSDGFKQGLKEKIHVVGEFLYNAIRTIYDNFPLPDFIQKPPFPAPPNWGAMVQGFASGTPSAPPGLAVVGEQGPELVNFRGGERVFNNRETREIMNQGRVVEVHHHHYNLTINTTAPYEPIISDFNMMRSVYGAKT